MIKVSNLRKESLPDSKEYRIVCDIDCSFSDSKQLWFSVPEEFGDWLTDDVYDAFMVAMLFPAMCYNERLIIEGCVSEKLYDNLVHYVQKCQQANLSYLNEIEIVVQGFKSAKKTNNLIGEGFTAGVDALATLYDRFVIEKSPDFRISALFFFNVGTHGGGGERARKKFKSRYNYLLDFVNEIGLPFVPMDSSLFDFYKLEWEYDAGVLCRTIGILVFERVLSKYYVASDYSFWEIVNMSSINHGAIINATNYSMLGTESLEIIVDGTQYKRSEKIARLLDYPQGMKYLNVCVGQTESPHNCSLCHKCLRTELALDILGKLEDFSDVFDIEKFKKQRFSYKCMTVLQRKNKIYAYDNCELAKKMHYPMPSYFRAWIYKSPWIMKNAAKKFVKIILRRNRDERGQFIV